MKALSCVKPKSTNMFVPQKSFSFGKSTLHYSIAMGFTRRALKGLLQPSTLLKIQRAARVVEEKAQAKAPIYGINTGFGPLCTSKISPAQTELLQRNILLSHSTGVGRPLEKDLIRLMLVLKIHGLAMGYSGVRTATIHRLLWHLEADVLPQVPSQGSVGASGDLAPLAHLGLPLIGKGKVNFRGSVVPTVRALEHLNLSPLSLGPKEGLALINGTQFIGAHAVVVLDRFRLCLEQADIIGALMLDAMQGSDQPFDASLHRLRPYKGVQHVAEKLSLLLFGSKIREAHKDCQRVQDPYSLRCMPQVHGASYAAWHHLKQLTHIEINAVTDNPLILENDRVVSGGNFHGQPLAMALDYAALAAAELGNISDRRVFLALSGRAPKLPKFLTTNAGVNSGFMMLQYTTAALVSENKSLCYPASADSIPTSLDQEDHVSMGAISGRKALMIVENLEKILAIELIVAAQALSYQRPLLSSPPLEKLLSFIRAEIPFIERDTALEEYMEKAQQWIRQGAIAGQLNDFFKVHSQKGQLRFRSEFDLCL
ncbi:MAG: histidine ammonia-lyase [Flavobacteriaceae bacterium]